MKTHIDFKHYPAPTGGYLGNRLTRPVDAEPGVGCPVCGTFLVDDPLGCAVAPHRSVKCPQCNYRGVLPPD